MEAQRALNEHVFRKFTRLERDRKCYIVDVRPYKEWKRHHILLSFCCRLSSNGAALSDCSKNRYDQKWVQQCWWNSDVIVVGGEGLKKDHEVVRYLAKENKCSSLRVYRDGIDAIQKAYPFLVGQSLNAHRGFVFPTPVEPCLFLGNWANASDTEKLDHLKIKRVVTIHNEPRNLKLPSHIRQMSITAPDLSTTDLTQYFHPSYSFIEEAISAERAVLLHCGAGSSRSATIAAAYLMRKHRWSAAHALTHLLSLRSSVSPNEGFWRQLCAFEATLAIPSAQRSDVHAPPAMTETFGEIGSIRVVADAAGDRARVDIRPAGVLGSPIRGKRAHDEDADGNDAEDSDIRNAKRQRASGEDRDAVGGGLRVTLLLDVTRDGDALGDLALDLKPLQVCTFGRDAKADVKLQHASLSRIHAQISVGVKGDLQLVDLGSTHGTNIDGVWVKANNPKQLRIGSKFRFAASTRMYCVREMNVSKR